MAMLMESDLVESVVESRFGSIECRERHVIFWYWLALETTSTDGSGMSVGFNFSVRVVQQSLAQKK